MVALLILFILPAIVRYGSTFLDFPCPIRFCVSEKAHFVNELLKEADMQAASVMDQATKRLA